MKKFKLEKIVNNNIKNLSMNDKKQIINIILDELIADELWQDREAEAEVLFNKQFKNLEV